MKERWILYIVFILHSIIVIFLWSDGARETTPLIAFGRIAGLILQTCVLLQLILVSRIRFIEHAFGLDRLINIHKIVGYGMLATIVTHPVFLILGYGQLAHTKFFEQLTIFITSWPHILFAFVGLCLLVVVGILSLPFIKKIFVYEWWRLVHFFMYVAIVLIFLHQQNGHDVSFGLGRWYWYGINGLVVGGLIAYRFLRPLYLVWRHQWRVEKVVQETVDVFSVYITGRDLEKFTFDAGQYIHVAFLARKLWFPHPFSLSQAYNGRSLRLSIKSVGDFTSEIRNLKPGTRLMVEGPFGRFTEQVAKRKKYLFIIGGIGITPARAMIELLSAQERDVELLYSNRTEQDVALRNEIEALNVHVHHFITNQAGGRRIDGNAIAETVPDYREREVYLCGPVGMMDSVRAWLKSVGIAKNQIHFEKFSY